MGVLAFLLDTKLGHMLIGVLCILIAGAGMYWRGHNKGWDAAVEHDKAVVAACMAANASQARTIGNLQAANQEWADAAKTNADKVNQAMAQVKAAQTNDARALAESQTRLHKLEADHGQAHAWAVTPVPADVLDALRADSVRQ